MPKSMRVRLSRVNMTLEGLRSRWIRGGSNASCSSRTAPQSFGNTSHARATDGSQRYTTSASVSPRTNSMTTTRREPTAWQSSTRGRWRNRRPERWARQSLS